MAGNGFFYDVPEFEVWSRMTQTECSNDAKVMSRHNVSATRRRGFAISLVLIAGLALSACGGHGHGTASGAPGYVVGGTVTGLSGNGLVLQLNGTTNLAVNAGASSYSLSPLASGATYSVTVLSQPTSPSQTCTVANPSGTITSADVTNVDVSCTANSFIIGGTVSGLTGSGLVLQLTNGANTTTLPVGASRSFTFSSNPVVSGTIYSVTVQTQPTLPAQTCVVVNGSGTVGNANLTNVQVNCTTNTSTAPQTIGGTVSGLSGSGLVLQLNGANDLAVSTSPFTFASTLTTGSVYTVTVRTQPTAPAQTCTVANPTGTVGSSNVTNVSVTCATNTYTVSGTVSRLSGSGLELQLNGGNNLSVSGSTFTFAPIADLSSYNVTVRAQPYSPAQTCTVTAGGSGVVNGAPVSGVQVTCDTNSYKISGTVSGLAGTGLALVNGGDTLNIGSNGSFSFPTAVLSGASYSVSVTGQPLNPAQTCTVAYPSGTVGALDVTNVQVTCATNTYTVGGTVAGLTGAGLVLQNNAGDNRTIAATDTSFVFATAIADKANYNVTVLTQPTGQTCRVTNASGTMNGTNVTTVQVTCTTPSWSGTAQFGTPADEVANGIATDASSNVYIAGCTGGALVNSDVNSYKNTCGTAGGNASILVRKYDVTGANVLWTQLLGVSTNDQANAIATDGSGNVYVTGVAHGSLDGQSAVGGDDIFLTKYDTNGNWKWTVEYGSISDDQGNAVIADASGHVYVVGTTFGSVDGQPHNSGNYDIFVTQFDAATGARSWTVEFGTSGGSTFGIGIATDAAGNNVYVSGTTLGALSGSNVGQEDVFVAQLSSAGNRGWTTQIGTIYPDYNGGVTVDPVSGAVYVTGRTGGSMAGSGVTNPTPGAYDVFVARLDATSGNISWIRQLASPGNDYATGVAARAGNVYVTGYTYGDIDGNVNQDSTHLTADMFLTMYDATGTRHWTRQFGTMTSEKAYAVATDPAVSGGAFVTGFTLGNFDGSVSSGGADIVVLKYAADGTKQ